MSCTCRRPTQIEDQAHAEVVRHFAGHLKQFPVSRDAVKHLERDISKTALPVLAVSQRPPQEIRFSLTAGNGIKTLIWTEDMTAQVKEFLAEKYPGRDMSRMADSFVHKFATQAVSQKHSVMRFTPASFAARSIDFCHSKTCITGWFGDSLGCSACILSTSPRR